MRYLKSRTFVVGLVLTVTAVVVIALTLDVKREYYSVSDQGGGIAESIVEVNESFVPLAIAATVGLVLMVAAAVRTRKPSI